jgi:hypothetical protein
VLRRQHHAKRSRHANRWRATYHHVAYGLGDTLCTGADKDNLLVR